MEEVGGGGGWRWRREVGGGGGGGCQAILFRFNTCLCPFFIFVLNFYFLLNDFKID